MFRSMAYIITQLLAKVRLVKSFWQEAEIQYYMNSVVNKSNRIQNGLKDINQQMMKNKYFDMKKEKMNGSKRNLN